MILDTGITSPDTPIIMVMGQAYTVAAVPTAEVGGEITAIQDMEMALMDMVPVVPTCSQPVIPTAITTTDMATTTTDTAVPAYTGLTTTTVTTRMAVVYMHRLTTAGKKS